MCSAERKLNSKPSIHTFSSDVSQPSYKIRQLTSSLNVSATIFMYNVEVAQKHAHMLLNQKLLLSVVPVCKLLRDLMKTAKRRHSLHNNVVVNSFSSGPHRANYVRNLPIVVWK
jgi:hypothetical protein